MDPQQPEPGAMDVMGEAIAAVSGGLERSVASPAKAISVTAQAAAIRLLTDIPDRVEKALEGDGTTPDRETPEGDYKELLAVLTDEKKKPTPGARLTLVEKLDKHTAVPYTLWFDRAFSTAGQLIPRRTWTTIFGPKPGTPSGTELGAWWRAWDVARDPMVVVERIADGTLITDEVDALNLFYPKLKERISSAAVLGLATLAARHGDDWLPADVTQRTVECLLGYSPLSQELATQIQNAAAAARQGEADKNAESMQGGSEIDGPKFETPTQRIADR